MAVPRQSIFFAVLALVLILAAGQVVRAETEEPADPSLVVVTCQGQVASLPEWGAIWNDTPEGAESAAKPKAVIKKGCGCPRKKNAQ